ncbi:MAG: glycosyltransferase family 2 protein [Bacteroidota bacterium]|nr:glycosyltransferase family 2 protein [Bacteroidota bacterium]
MTPIPSVAIVILNWNGKHFLEKFLPSVIASDYEKFSIIVADNASTDDSVPFLQTHYSFVRIIMNPVNEGFAKGYNTAIKQVSADYYILLNSDVEVVKDWIRPVISLMESDKRIAACQPKILSYNDKTKFEYAGASGGWIDKYGYPFSRGRVFDFCETDEGQYDTTEEIFWATGAAFFVRATIFHELNGFDEHFFAHQEEIDLCWRMQRAGYKIYVVPSSVVYHVGGGTLPKGNERKVFLNFRNNLLMLAKNLPASEKFRIISFRICLDNIAGLQALVKGDWKTFRAVQKAHLNFIKLNLKHKNRDHLPKIKFKKLAGVFNGSVVQKYFVEKKRTFSEILGFKK